MQRTERWGAKVDVFSHSIRTEMKKNQANATSRNGCRNGWTLWNGFDYSARQLDASLNLDDMFFLLPFDWKTDKRFGFYEMWFFFSLCRSLYLSCWPRSLKNPAALHWCNRASIGGFVSSVLFLRLHCINNSFHDYIFGFIFLLGFRNLLAH